MEIFPFLFLILKGFYKGFQMRYHLFFNSNGKAVKTIKMFFWKSAVCNQELVSVFTRNWSKSAFYDQTLELALDLAPVDWNPNGAPA